MNFTDIVRNRATQLSEDGTVACVIGWTAGRFEYQRTPFCANDAEQAALLVCDQHCEHALGKYVLEQKDKGRVGLITRGCESRAINRLIADNQLKREDVYLIGIPCTGCTTRDGAELKRCYECQFRNPVVYDELVGELAPEPKNDRFADVRNLEAMTREHLRLAFPRRVFTLSQTEYVIDRVKWLFDHRELVGGLRFVHEPATLRFFTGVLKPIGDWPEKLAAAYRADFGEEQ